MLPYVAISPHCHFSIYFCSLPSEFKTQGNESVFFRCSTEIFHSLWLVPLFSHPSNNKIIKS